MNKTQVSLERPTLQRIRAVAKEIASRFHPIRIILFGSYASGKPTQDSDVDLLIIMETEQRPVEQAYTIRRAPDFPFPVDLLVRTPEQVEERLAMGECFIREIISQGNVLYEAYHE